MLSLNINQSLIEYILNLTISTIISPKRATCFRCFEHYPLFELCLFQTISRMYKNIQALLSGLAFLLSCLPFSFPYIVLMLMPLHFVLSSTEMKQGHRCDCEFEVIHWRVLDSAVSTQLRTMVLPLPYLSQPIVQRWRVEPHKLFTFLRLIGPVLFGPDAYNSSCYDLMSAMIVGV